MKEYILYAVKIGRANWQEDLITTMTPENVKDKMPKAAAWARANGFDRLRLATIDLELDAPPVFGANLLEKPGKK